MPTSRLRPACRQVNNFFRLDPPECGYVRAMNHNETNHFIWTFIDLPQMDGASDGQLLGTPI